MRIPVFFASALIGVLVASPASAGPTEPSTPDYAWQVTSAPAPAAQPPAGPAPQLTPRLRTPADARSQRAEDEEDFKTECLNRPESRTPAGWTRSRFEQCFIGSRTVDLRSRRDGSSVAKIVFQYSLLAFPVDTERRVDYLFDFDTFTTSGGEPLPVTTLSVDFMGCTTNVVCSKTPTGRSELVPDWKTAPSRRYEFAITSPNGVGEGDWKIIRGLMQLNMSVVTAAPDILPWTESAMANSRVRFDSAGSKLGQGKFNGAIFSDHVPTLELHTGPGSNHVEEARHVYDALYNPKRTFPSLLNKSVPGLAGKPLHRLMNDALKDRNTRLAINVCVDVWGEEYPSNGTNQCDEYPFKTTYEGAATSTGATEQNPGGGNEKLWHGSSRPIDADQNGEGGNVLALFYGQNRVLDENVGTAKQGTPSEPFYVRVIA
jgi:hypothetical protein